MERKPDRNQPSGFIEGKGFYIVLFLCVAAIAVSGYYLFRGLMGEPTAVDRDPIAAVSAPMDGQDAADPTPATPTPKTPEPAASSAATQPDAQDQPKQEEPAPPNEEAAASTAYVWPVQGEVERDFSLEVFAYDATMGDWRTHSGLDIAAPLGTAVSACANGTVSEVRADPMMGTTVTVSHSGGIESVYANLAESLNVQEGTVVETGTVLGTVGTTAIAESAAPSHLHFELREYGTSIDPTHYLH